MLYFGANSPAPSVLFSGRDKRRSRLYEKRKTNDISLGILFPSLIARSTEISFCVVKMEARGCEAEVAIFIDWLSDFASKAELKCVVVHEGEVFLSCTAAIAI